MNLVDSSSETLYSTFCARQAKLSSRYFWICLKPCLAGCGQPKLLRSCRCVAVSFWSHFSLKADHQSLVIPFAFLIQNQRDIILDLVENVNIEGRSGLDILVNTWCENAETFQGFWQTRVSTLALSQLFLAERPTLQNLMVKGDIIVTAETKNGEWPIRGTQVLGS